MTKLAEKILNKNESELQQLIKALIKFVAEAKKEQREWDKKDVEYKEYAEDIKAAEHIIQKYS